MGAKVLTRGSAELGLGLILLLLCLAVTGPVRLIHLSDAYLSEPNQGVNTLTFLIGVTWFFQAVPDIRGLCWYLEREAA